MSSLLDRLKRRIREKETVLCVGIDPSLNCPNIRSLSAENLHSFLDSLFTKCAKLVELTAPFVCCFKPNVAFFEQFGPKGLEVLQKVCKCIPSDIPIILDAKRAATGDAAEAYANAFFSIYGGDCITLDPYLGKDAIIPFLKRRGKGAFVVCRSSNPKSDDIQKFRIDDGTEVYLHVAKICEECRAELEPDLSANGGLLGLVVGATYPEDMQKLRKLYPALWFLAPGVGAQGGSLEATVKAGMKEDGFGLVINVGRAIADSEVKAEKSASANLSFLLFLLPLQQPDSHSNFIFCLIFSPPLMLRQLDSFVIVCLFHFLRFAFSVCQSTESEGGGPGVSRQTERSDAKQNAESRLTARSRSLRF
ncbi:hypothetical protein Efla_003681 [Eimeria flavescens]